ncbi:MAG TPA: hypothetical protein VM165_16680 [Planctomycetaceae bacterium]|nr:hypothetical protein [Planctomycetaceae bacterium]
MSDRDIAAELARIQAVINDRWELWRDILSPTYAPGAGPHSAPTGWVITQRIFRGYAAPGVRPRMEE